MAGRLFLLQLSAVNSIIKLMLQAASGLIFTVLGLGLVLFLVRHDRGAKEPDSALWTAFGFGALAIALTVGLQLPLVALGLQGVGDKAGLEPGALVIALLFSAAVEEVCKFLPLAWFIRRKSYFNETTDGIIYFALSGLAFSVLENFMYVIQGGGQLGLIRSVLILFLHPATTAIVGFYFARAKVRHEGLAKTAMALGAVILLHTLYNFGLVQEQSAWLFLASFTATLLLNGGLFWYFVRAESIDESLGLAAVGSNRFCRHCGWTNPDHMLYCEHCGKQA